MLEQFGSSVLEELDYTGEAYNLRLNPNLTMAVKALTQAEAITKLLYPKEI